MRATTNPRDTLRAAYQRHESVAQYSHANRTGGCLPLNWCFESTALSAARGGFGHPRLYWLIGSLQFDADIYSELTSTDLPRLRTITLTHGLAAGMISAAGQRALLLPFLPAQDGYKRVFVNLRNNIVSLTCGARLSSSSFMNPSLRAC